MRLFSGSKVLLVGLIALSFSACRPKAKRAAPNKVAASTSATAPSVPRPTLSPSQRYYETKPFVIEALAALRSKARQAIRSTTDKRTTAIDSMVALAQALSDAPGSAVLAIELTKAARRAHDPNRLRRYRQIAGRSILAFPKLSSVLGSIDKAAGTKTSGTQLTDSVPAGSHPATKLDGVRDFRGACDWLKKSFELGHPPTDYVGEQGADSLDCEIAAPYRVARELLATTLLVTAKGKGERVFAWVAAKQESVIWLSPLIAESFAPTYHPYGNGFSVELQRTEAYRAGLPELTAYVSEHSTIMDVVLNEMVFTERHRSIVMTFDTRPPQASPAIELHTRTARSTIDPSDDQLPKGYEHSRDIGTETEESFRLEWGDNQVRLTRTQPQGAKAQVQLLFNATTSAH